jgi:hypothetical protein
VLIDFDFDFHTYRPLSLFCAPTVLECLQEFDQVLYVLIITVLVLPIWQFHVHDDQQTYLHRISEKNLRYHDG